MHSRQKAQALCDDRCIFCCQTGGIVAEITQAQIRSPVRFFWSYSNAPINSPTFPGFSRLLEYAKLRAKTCLLARAIAERDLRPDGGEGQSLLMMGMMPPPPS
jgi:hypothetical protein